MNDDVLNGGPRANLREIVARGWMVHKERNGERRLGRELLGGPGVTADSKGWDGNGMFPNEKKGGFNMFQHLKGTRNEVE